MTNDMLLTCCWATDGYTKAGGCTSIIPGSNVLRRHPNAEEVRAKAGEVPIECPPGAVAMWDGNLWHSSYPRSLEGERVVCHITYTRLMMRPVEDYSQHAERLVREHGPRMSQLLGREDMGEVLGITTETASRVIADFKRRGLVKEEKGVCSACDCARLAEVANA